MIPDKEKVLWVDLLCPSSMLKILWLSRRTPIKTICYVHIVKTFSFIIPLLQRLTGKPVVPMNWLKFGEERMEGLTVYEYFHHLMRAGE